MVKVVNPVTGKSERRISRPAWGIRRGVGSLLALLVLSCLTCAAASAETALQEITYNTLPGDQLQLVLTMSGPAPQPASFTISDPARIALDFPNTTNKLASRNVPIGVGVARSVTAVEAGGRTRVVVNLARLVDYKAAVQGNQVLVTLGGGGVAAAAPPAVATSARVPAGRSNQGVRTVDFRRGEQGEGRVVVTLSDASMVVDLDKRGDRLIVTIPNAQLSDEMVRRLDVTDFATPVRTVDTFREANGVRMIITAAGEYDHLAYQADTEFTVDVKPITKAEQVAEAARRKPKYTGERLSLNFQDIDVRAVLQLLADFTGLNMVTSDTVTGSLTLRLKNVPWDQALDIILKSKGLAMRQQDNVIMVAPAEEIAAREKLELEAAKQVEELAPLRRESLQVNYAKASEIAALLKAEGNSLLSGRGNITIDERTNKLLIMETDENINAIVNLVTELDVPVRQVLIESRIVLATTDFGKEFGVRWGATWAERNGDREIVTSGDLNATTQYFRGDDIEAPDRWNVNLPVTNLASTAGSIALAMAKLPGGRFLELELSAAQAEGLSETVSTPRVITANQREAVIETGQEIPYQEASSSGATSTSFKKAVLSLKVTPQITPDDRVIMDLEVSKDAPDFANRVNGVPPINTQSVTTQVLVDNGQTVVLGGVFEQTKSNQINRVPFLGDLPVLGGLFRNSFESDDKSELLIFVTPKIIKEGALLTSL
ncbi:MAG: pilus assembly protein PilQ [Gammaproteobacteria bacterium SG8_47]|nr:MAG: pilus assembly protein PilQ [Gammaproteobacteria bacterium SG8_47]